MEDFLFLIIVVVVVLLFFLTRLIKQKVNRPQADTTFRTARKSESNVNQELAGLSAQRLVEIINESLQVANNSKNAETKVSRLDLAKEKLIELKSLAKENSFIKINQLADVELSIKTLEWEFEKAKYREAADGNMRGQALEKEGKIAEAIGEYEQLLEQKVDTPFTYRRLAILYSKKKDRENELRVIKEALNNLSAEDEKHYQWFKDRFAKKSC